MSTLELADDAELVAVCTVTAETAAGLNLPPTPHGLFLVTEGGGNWSLATADMDFFTSVIESAEKADLDFTSVIMHTGGETWRLVFGWPGNDDGGPNV